MTILGPDHPLMHSVAAAAASVSLPTPGRRREDKSPCMAAEWLDEWKESDAPGVIGRLTKAAAATGHMSGQSGPRDQALIKSSCAGNIPISTREQEQASLWREVLC